MPLLGATQSRTGQVMPPRRSDAPQALEQVAASGEAMDEEPSESEALMMASGGVDGEEATTTDEEDDSDDDDDEDEAAEGEIEEEEDEDEEDVQAPTSTSDMLSLLANAVFRRASGAAEQRSPLEGLRRLPVRMEPVRTDLSLQLDMATSASNKRSRCLWVSGGCRALATTMMNASCAAHVRLALGVVNA